MAKQSIQPDISIGLVGHVDHGKTTLTQHLSGKWTDTHSEELKRGITIRLGYANFSIFEKDKKLNTKEGTLKRTVSIIDAPGHESLMATMLSGAAIMDGALLLVAANEVCPQPQTVEHLKALEIVGMKNLIVVQNKIDLVEEKQALANYKEIKAVLKSTSFKDAPIIPISAQHDVNMDMLLQAIEDTIPTPKRDTKKDPMMFVARSFDINKPGSKLSKMVGGVLGGALKEGVFKVGDEIEIKPGYAIESKNQQIWKSITTKITGLMSGSDQIKEVSPGGSIAVMTSLDPSIIKSDTLAGNVVGHKDKLPPVWEEVIMDVTLLDRVVGAKDKLVVDPLKTNEPVMLNVNAATTVGIITKLKKNAITFDLKLPICAQEGARVTLSRRIGQRWRLIGFGIIK
jgi:translation initiation factor 2 subunit 3